MFDDTHHMLAAPAGGSNSGAEYRYQPIPMNRYSEHSWEGSLQAMPCTTAGGHQQGLQPPPPQHQVQKLQGGAVQTEALSAASWPEPIGDGEMLLEERQVQANGDAPLTPSAPPYSEMEKIAGYDDILQPTVTYVTPPPSYQEATSGSVTSTVENFVTGSKLTEHEARDLLVALTRSKCCWGKRAAVDMYIVSLQQSTAVHYMLKTFLETRSTDWASEPFRGQRIDGPHNGTPPPPWDIVVRTPSMFHDTVINVEVPHTASVRSCHRCHGAGSIQCASCCGWGRYRCYSCNGTGTATGLQQDSPRRMCYVCDGSGQRQCEQCHGRGRVTCNVCESTGQVKYFVKLTVAFKTHTKDFILERSLLPNHLIREVPGLTLFEDTQQLLNPIQSFPEMDVNTESAKIIDEHRALSQTGRIWMQNHVIRGVPVFQCDCQWKDKEFQFFVYGDNRQVHTVDYPQTCCCGCQLL